MEIINPLEYPAWDDLLLSTPGYSFFHTSMWTRVLAETYGYTPLSFSIIKADRIRLYLPFMEVSGLFRRKRGVSLPFTDYLEPIVANGVSLEECLKQVIEYGRKAQWRYVELRGGGAHLEEKQPSDFCYLHDLDLRVGKERLLSNLKPSTRRNIRRADNEGVCVEMSDSIEFVTLFYRLNCLTRRAHGLPPQPYLFFKKVHEHIISKGHGSVLLAKYRGRPVAGAIFFHFGEKALYKFGASDRRYQSLRANNSVMWCAINEYAARGCKTFSFGRTEPENTGLRKFKTGWGAVQSVANYYRYSLSDGAFVTVKPLVSGSHNSLFRRLPVPLLRLVGSLAYKYMG